MSREQRTYPQGCTSALCGRLECEGCPDEPHLQEFKAWRERTQAVRLEPTWSPSIWTATGGNCTHCGEPCSQEEMDEGHCSLCFEE